MKVEAAILIMVSKYVSGFLLTSLACSHITRSLPISLQDFQKIINNLDTEEHTEHRPWPYGLCSPKCKARQHPQGMAEIHSFIYLNPWPQSHKNGSNSEV